MKKLFFSALAIASLVACSKDELVSQPKPMAITFEQAFIENATRVATAEDPSITTATIDGFDVWGFMDETAGTVFVDQDVTGSKEAGWTYNPLQYWMPDHTYYFGALAPMNSANWELNTENANTSGAGVVSFTNVDGTEDLLYAATTASTVGMEIGQDMEPVKLTFNHLLSKVKFSFTNGFTSDNAKIVVKNVQMVVPKAASIDLAQADWWSTNQWENYKETITLDFGDVNNVNSKLAMGMKEEAAYERLTIPTDAYDYAISFDVELYMGDVLALESKKETTVNVALEIGKAYNFCTVLDASNIADEALQPIEFEVVEVKEWVDAGVVDVYNVTASTEEELLAALTGKDANIAITSDITLKNNESIKISGGNVIINLGGHSITSPKDGFEVAGGTLTINGEGNINAASNDEEPYCAVWAYGDAVVNIYGGTYGIGYPTGDYNDLIYAKDNAIINIYAGKFYNSGREDSFVLNLKDGSNADINVYGGEYEKFDPANNKSEGEGTNFVVSGYKSVKDGDWYKVYAL